MQIPIEGIAYNFVPIKEFRAAHRLPVSFNIALFEPKDYTGLGRIDTAGAALNHLRTVILAALPEHAEPMNWLGIIANMTHLFQTELYRINDQIGLRDVEIEYAVAGFNDALQAYAYTFIYAATTHTPLPDFLSIYTEWLNGTIRVFSEQHAYLLDDRACTIQVIAHAYGRIGLLIRADNTYAVYDPALACPAEGFMTTLLTEVAAHMQQVSS